MKQYIPQMEPWFGDEERDAVFEYMGSGGWITEYKKTEQFERMVADYTGFKHCIAVNNGTISLTLAALACGVKAGDEVLVPNYTMIATPNSIQLLGAIPKFVDVEQETLCLDIGKVKQAISSLTKAIILVSANGRYPKAGIEAFVRLCQERNLVFIEDAAQSLGSFYPNGKHVGTMGQVGSFSFSAPKIISTGQGGIVGANDGDVAARIRKLKDFGRPRPGTDMHDSVGYNFKFTDLQACVGLEQMKKLPMRVARKKEIHSLYQSNLDGVSQVRLFQHDTRYTVPWFIDALVERRDELRAYLKEKGIGTRVMYPPINEQKAYQVFADCPVSRMVGQNGLWLPSASQLDDKQVVKVCECVREFYRAT